ncbi:MAG: hypothetical protein M1837_007490 [Sclerophora amabilis]|nr:MAG: hypothetical protein M1837_007490 [Sclerophora amabilis]
METVHAPSVPTEPPATNKAPSGSSLTEGYGPSRRYVTAADPAQERTLANSDGALATSSSNAYPSPPSMSHPSPRPSVTRLNSSPNYGAMTAARQAASHGKIHKRTGSVSSVVNAQGSHVITSSPLGSRPPSPTFHPSPRPYVHEQSSPMSPCSPTSAKSKSKTRIRPLVRKKFSYSREDNSLDLSRSAFDNESGDIYNPDSKAASRSAADLTFSPLGPTAASHNRSTSGTSQLSTGTSASGQRHYVHPMRQTPRSFTPPLSQSYANSVPGSEDSGEGVGLGLGVDEEQQPRQVTPDTAQSRGGQSYTSSTSNQLPLRIQTDLSSSRLVHGSQTNLAQPPSSLRLGADTMSASEPSPPVSRSSLEQALRIRNREPLDPSSRAASIRAARLAFTEKEDIKAEKAVQLELKAADREHRRRERREAAQRRRSEAKEQRVLSRSATNEMVEVLAGREYSSMKPAQPRLDSGMDSGPEQSQRMNPPSKSQSSAQSTWVSFIVWLKTRLLKLGRKMSGKS